MKEAKRAGSPARGRRWPLAPDDRRTAGQRSPRRGTSPLPRTSNSLSRSEAIKRITAWIERDFLNDNVTYAEIVDWYDQGTISREDGLEGPGEIPGAMAASANTP